MSKKTPIKHIKAVGWRLLLEPRQIEEKTVAGIIIPDQIRDIEQYGEIVLRVADVGPQAYLDARFNGEAWVKEGDWVVVARHAGWRITNKEQEYRVVNDDEIIAVLDDPDFLR